MLTPYSSVAQTDIVCGSGTYRYGLASTAGDLLGTATGGFTRLVADRLYSGKLHRYRLNVRASETSGTVQSVRGELEADLP